MKKYLLSFVLLSAFTMMLHAAGGLRAFNLPQGGYMVIDDQNVPVALSDRGTVDDMSDNMIRILGGTPEMISTAEAAKVPAFEFIPIDSVGPVLGDIAFDQDAPYNRQTPMYRSQHCLTGCVATAMAQILTYYQHPKQCSPGTKNYTTLTNKIQVSYTFDNVTFDWSKILHHYNRDFEEGGRNYTDEQADEVAKLMAACGAAVEMDYGLDGSGSVSQLVPDALSAFFDYHLGTRFENKSDFLNDAEFNQALIDEFKAGRPVYVGASSSEGGHAFVMDGAVVYQGLEAYPYFHFNWGWNGGTNEWARIRDVEFNQTMRIIRFIQPNAPAAVEDTRITPAIQGIYDILGNRVTDMIPGNIYIVNGQKILAR